MSVKAIHKLSALLALSALLGFVLPFWLGRMIGVASLLGLFGMWIAPGTAGGRKVGSWIHERRGWLAPLFVTGVATALFWPLLLGNMPQSADHPVHLTRAWHFLTQNLANGDLSGWSDFWFAGWPSGEDYPPLGDYWYTLWFALTGSLLGWEGTYALSFLTMMVFVALALYTYGRVYWNAYVGALMALFFLLDKGAYREGGWTYTVTWGVWPQVLSTGFCFLAFALFWVVVRKRSVGAIVAASLAVGCSILAHPMGLVVFLIGVPLWLLARLLTETNGGFEKGIWVVLSVGIGFALAAYWIVPFASKGAWMAKYGELWMSLPEMGRHIWKGTLFRGTAAPIVWLGIVGMAYGIWRRNMGALFSSLFAAAFLIVGSKTFFHELDLLSLSQSFGQIQFQRFVIPAKPAFFALAALAVVGVLTSWKIREEGVAYKRALRWGIVGLCLAPLMAPLWTGWLSGPGAGVGKLTLEADLGHREDYEKFLEWSATLRDTEEDFFRIAYVRPYNDHIFAAAPVFNGIPAYKVGFTPCTNFIHKPDQANPKLYKALSVKYIVSLRGRPKKGEREVKRFGSVRVFEFLDYDPQRYTVEGPGAVDMERFSPHEGEIVFHATGSTNESSLLLHVAPFPNWVAEDETGASIPLESVPFDGKASFMRLPLRDGEIRVRYSTPALDRVTGILSAAAWFFLFFLGLLNWRGKTEGMRRWMHRAEIHPFVAKGGVWVVLLMLGSALLVGKLSASGSSTESFVDQLPSAQVWVETKKGDAVPCEQVSAGRFSCSDKAWNYVGRSEVRVGGAIRRCIWAHPTARGPLHVVFPEVAMGEALLGHHGYGDVSFAKQRRRGSTTARVLVEGKEIGVLKAPKEKGWNSWTLDTRDFAGETRDVEWVISAKNTGKEHYCFDAWVQEIDRP